ncbi:MAG: ATP-binding cassette domain-containing protein [Ruminococcus flavefaciens]|nr:ATP-binding cassette domain-containing protein [Ruminococcus flavefaciens]
MSFFEHVVNVPIEFYSCRRTGDVLSRFNDASGICQSISNIILEVLINCTLMFFYGIFLFGISPQLFCIVLASCVMCFLIVCIFKEKLRNNQMDLLAHNADVNSNLKENVEGIKTIKVYRLENNAANKFFKSFHKLVQKGFHNTMLESLQSILVTLLSSVSVIVVLWIGVDLCLNGVIQVGALISFYVMMSSFISPVQSLIALQPEFQSVIVSAERLNDVFDIERENALTGNSEGTEKIETLEIRNMTFSYGYALPILKDTSFQIKQGEHIAVLGKNGCGKTTLANILMGLYQVDDAEFLINNEAVSANIYKSFAAKIAYIPQESFFFSDSIYENLICGNENISEREIMEVLDLCCLIDFVKELPQCIYTRLEEGATNLSAGTKRKLAIARAILNKPEIIILDESTSNIDLETEKEIIQLFHDLGDTVSIIDISHRIRDYSKYDKVYYLAENKLSLKAERR